MTTTDGSVKVGEALTRLYADHALPPDGGEHESWFHVRIGPLSIPLPNPPARQRAVFIHDVNHLLTGYNALFSDGEMKIAAFEVGAGCGRVWVAWLLNLSLMSLGAFVHPRAVFAAFVRGCLADSLYVQSISRETLRGMTVDEVRRMTRLDALALTPSLRHYVAFGLWVASTWMFTIGVLWILVSAVLTLVRIVWP